MEIMVKTLSVLIMLSFIFTLGTTIANDIKIDNIKSKIEKEIEELKKR